MNCPYPRRDTRTNVSRSTRLHFIRPLPMIRPHMASRIHILLLSFLIIAVLLPQLNHAADDLMDRYLSLPGSFSFVRRAPERTVAKKIVLTVFEDFLCSHCYEVFTTLIPTLKKKYSQKIDIHFRAVPVVHASSQIPARAYAISHELGLSEEMQQALFHAQFEENINTGSRDGIAHVANSIGLDPELLLSQLESGGGKAELEESIALGDSYHIEGVPTMILDGWIRVNDLSPQNIETIIDGLLERKRGKQ